MPISINITVLPTKDVVDIYVEGEDGQPLDEYQTRDKPPKLKAIPVRGGETLQRHIGHNQKLVVSQRQPKLPGQS